MKAEEFNISQEDFELVERLHQGDLTVQERALLEEKMKASEALSQFAEEYLIYIDAIETSAFRSKLSEIEETVQFSQDARSPKKSKPSLNLIRFVGIAAAVIVSVCIIGYLWNAKASSYESIYASHFKPDPGLPTKMGIQDKYSFNKGMVSYRQGKYKEAIKEWTDLYVERKDSDTLTYFLGAAHLADHNLKEAKRYLEATKSLEKNTFQKESEYYLGLCFLAEGNVKDAINVLRDCQDGRAEALLKEVTEE